MLSCVWLFVIPWTAARLASLSMQVSRPRILEWDAILLLQEIFPTHHCSLVEFKFLMISSLRHWLCKCLLFTFHKFVNFPVFLMLLVSNIILLSSEKIFYMIYIFLNLLTFNFAMPGIFLTYKIIFLIQFRILMLDIFINWMYKADFSWFCIVCSPGWHFIAY